MLVPNLCEAVLVPNLREAVLHDFETCGFYTVPYTNISLELDWLLTQHMQ